MTYHPCVLGCGRYLAPQDSHDCCLTCLGIQHAEEAFVDGSCSSCGDMTILELHNRLRYVKHGGVTLPLPRSGVRPGTRGGTASGGPRQTRRQVQVALRRGQPRDGGDCSSGDGDCTTFSPGGGPAGESFISFCFCSTAGPGGHQGRSGSAELDGTSGDEGELDGATGDKGELGGTSGDEGELGGTSGDEGELGGTKSRGRSGSADSRGCSGGADSRGCSGELDGISRGTGVLDGTSRGTGVLDGTNRGSGELDGTNRGFGELDGTSRGTGEHLRGVGTGGHWRGVGTGGHWRALAKSRHWRALARNEHKRAMARSRN